MTARCRVAIVPPRAGVDVPMDARLHALTDALRDAGHTVEVLADVDAARRRCDVLLLCGPDDVARVRAVDAALPVLVLDMPARDDTDDERTVRDDASRDDAARVAARVEALTAGADDALTLPAAPSQAVARVDALGRRAALLPRAHTTFEVDGCTVDLDTWTATRHGVSYTLSALEARLLAWLHTHRDRAVPRDELLVHVWDASPRAQTRTIDMTVARLRKKLERDPERPRVVLSIKGVGYRLGAVAGARADVTRK